MYRVLWGDGALEDLKKLDKKVAKQIVAKVSSYLAMDPLGLGKPLSGNLGGLMRYRYGDYRIIYEVFKKDITVAIIRVGHRSNVYE